jgi:putative endonuclease
MNEWSVYIIRCDDRYLYTGISTDVKRRVDEHSAGDSRAAKFTKPFSSIELVYEVVIGSRSLASKIEYKIKKLSRQKKEFIISRCLNGEDLITFIKLDR